MLDLKTIDDFALRLARDDESDAAEFCNLWRLLYARPVGAAYVSWQFFQPPLPAYLGMAATLNGQFAGCLDMQVREAASGGVSTAWVIDIMTVPAFQRCGVFRRLSTFTAQTVAQHRPVALCVMANERADAAAVSGLGWRRVNVFTTYLCSTVTSEASPPHQLAFVPVDTFTALEDFLSRSMELVPVRLGLHTSRRDARYLDWRFGINPRYAYERFAAVSDRTTVGYVVLKSFRDPVTDMVFGDIVDLAWSVDDRTVIAEILQFALSRFMTLGIRRVAMWLQTNTLLDEVGLSLGFRPTEQKRYFCVNVLDPVYAWLEDPERWYLTMADSEVY